MQNNQAGGGPQYLNQTGTLAGATAGTPGSVVGEAPTDGGQSQALPQSPALARSPASGAPFGYGQPSGMMGGGFNAAGFGGPGAMGGKAPVRAIGLD